VSIDVGLLERSRAVAVVRGEFAWDDVGTWQALTRVRPKDTRGNVVVGDAVLHDSEECVVWSDRDPIVLYGVKELVVVQANGRILVMPADRAESMKHLLDALPPAVRDVTS
jgi:mannose-1-phosphate guanylyltransferase